MRPYLIALAAVSTPVAVFFAYLLGRHSAFAETANLLYRIRGALDEQIKLGGMTGELQRIHAYLHGRRKHP